MQPDQPSNDNRKLIASFIVIAAVVIVAFGVNFFAKTDQPAESNSAATTSTATTGDTSQSTATNSTEPADTATSGSDFKDGSYSASGSYATPEGQESITVNITIADGTVTGTSLGQNGSNRETREYQAKFASGYEAQVIGKALSEISLSRVSGSSLTSNGFNKALQTIKDQAQG